MRAPVGSTLAALDCGTNSTRLLIASDDGVVIDRQMRVTRLGQGVDATRELAPEAIRRTLEVLTDYRRAMDAHGVGRARLVATSAVRDATNGGAFLRAATEATGVPAELLSGEEEGRLSHAGAVADLPPASGDDVVLDIGGGSTELVVERDGVLGAVSLDLGCVRLTERHLRHDPPGPAELAAAVAHVDDELDRAVARVPGLGALRPGSRLIGLAGTVSTLAMLVGGVDPYDRDRVHHARLSASDVARWCDLLAAEPASARAGRAGMTPGRQDVIVGGAIVLREVMARLGFETCLVSESDILDGLVGSLRTQPAGTAP
ncbi:MAG TPA: Ppx/GppA phosphatase family protein [Acidimicrobiales bacterium]|jgi:exopolyphosphatase/guanosine-5'-triphosphate,3'-diphosphate pyrophosphatase